VGCCRMTATVLTKKDIYLSLSKWYSIGKYGLIGCASVVRGEQL
jgi:hypothetical protein